MFLQSSLLNSSFFLASALAEMSYEFGSSRPVCLSVRSKKSQKLPRPEYNFFLSPDRLSGRNDVTLE